MTLSMKSPIARICLYSILIALLFVGVAQAQQYPLSENSWDNPGFVDRFLGSYGVVSAVEPQITQTESELFQDLSALLSQKNTSGGITLLSRHLSDREGSEKPPSAAINYTLGSLYLQNGEADRAIAQYRIAIQKFPTFLRAYKNLGLAFIQKGQFEDGISCLSKSLELGDGDGNSYGLIGYAYLNTGNYASALDAYGLASVLMPKNKDWKIGRAMALFRNENFREAIASFRELIHSDPTRVDFYISVANAYIALGEQSQAVPYLEMVRRMKGGGKIEAIMLLGDIYVNQSLPRLALQVYLEALDKKDGSVKISRLLRFGNALTQRSAYAEAERLITAIPQRLGRALNPDEELSLLILQSEVDLGQGQSEAAAAVLEKVLGHDPMNGHALMLLATYSFEKGNYETAEYYLDRSENIPDYAVQSLIQHARIKVAQQQYGDAIEFLEKAQSIRPQTNVANYLRAVQNVYEARSSGS